MDSFANSMPAVTSVSATNRASSSSRKIELLRRWVDETSDISDNAAAKKFLSEHDERRHGGVYQMLKKLRKIKEGGVTDVYQAADDYLRMTGVEQASTPLIKFAEERKLSIFDLSKQINKRRSAMLQTVVDAPVPETANKHDNKNSEVFGVEQWAIQAVEMRDKEDARRYMRSKGLPLDIGFEKAFKNLQDTLKGTSSRSVAIRYSQLTPEQQSAIGLGRFAQLFGVPKSTVRRWIAPTGKLAAGSLELHNKLVKALPFNADEYINSADYINVSAPPLISLEPGGSSSAQGEEGGGASPRRNSNDVFGANISKSLSIESSKNNNRVNDRSGSAAMQPLERGLENNTAGDNATVLDGAPKGYETMVSGPRAKNTVGSRKKVMARNFELAVKYAETPTAQRLSLKDFANAEGVSRSNLNRWITADATWRKGPYAKTATARASATVPAPQTPSDQATQSVPVHAAELDSSFLSVESLDK